MASAGEGVSRFKVERLKPFNDRGEFQRTNRSEGLRRVAVRSAGITLLGRSISFLVQLGSTMVLARLLPPSDFGVVTMVTTFSFLFSSFGMNGFPELIMQREEITDSLASNLFWINLSIGCLLALVFANTGPLIGSFYHNTDVARVAEGMSIGIAIGSAGWIHYGLLQRAMRFRALAIIGFTGSIIQVIVYIALAKAQWHFWALVCGSIANTSTITIGVWLVCRWLPSWPSRSRGTASSFKYAMNVYWHFAFSYLTRNTDNLLVGWRYGARALGLYKKAYDLFVLAETQLMGPISAVAVSTLSKVNQDREQFQRYFLRAISVLALIGMGIGTDFALVGKDIIRFLLGPAWDQAGQIFSLFGPGIGAMLLYDSHGWIHLSLGRPERWFRWALIEFVCTAGLFLLTIRWGPTGIAFAWTASYFLLMFPSFWYAGKPIGLGAGPVFGAVWKFMAASIAAGCVTALIFQGVLHLEMPLSAAGALLRLASVSLVFFVLYLCGIIAFYRGPEPIYLTIRLLSDVLPESIVRIAFPATNDAQETTIHALREEAK